MENDMQHIAPDSDKPFTFSPVDVIDGIDDESQDAGFTELSAALAAASHQLDNQWTNDPILESVSNNSTAFSSPLAPGTPITRPKIGSRFSRDVIRTLKNWLGAHQQHQYPREDDMMGLQQKTGLNQAQLANWFANARRRGKVQAGRPASPQVRTNMASPVDIIPRPGTPAIRQDPKSKDPLQRWVDSPPEHEPADVGDIARAMTSSSRKQSHTNSVTGFDYAFNESWRSQYISSASSAGTSQSSEKSAHHSSGSQSSFKVRRVSRRKRVARRRPIEAETIAKPVLPYQCTFCTEEFRTKYDWQRHEKSLHLPLEKWVCALHGPRASKPESTDICCVFCGEIAPTNAHLEAHHYSSCQDRDLDERTFHRKDHLVQHLRVVHNAKYESWSMKSWSISMPDIKARCGFCGLEMDTWSDRTDHLADHFKVGARMSDWKGDWGFEESTLQLVENSVPPYFIEYERSTFVPMRASDPPWGSPPNGYELLKIETEFFIQNSIDTKGKLPSNDAIQLEACRIIFAADATLDAELNPTSVVEGDSWLRDLIMSSADLTQKARFGPLRTAKDSRHSSLTINGKDQLFQRCPLEAQLRAFVLEQQMMGIAVTDTQLQTQLCKIIRQIERDSITPSDMFANWIVKGIYSGTTWLESFKLRTGVTDRANYTAEGSQPFIGQWAHNAHESLASFDHAQNPPYALQQLPSFDTESLMRQLGYPGANMTSSTAGGEHIVPHVKSTMFDMHGHPKHLLPDDTNFFRIFEGDLRRWVSATMSPRNPSCHVPSDEEIQHQARWIMYNSDDSWNQTPADFLEWLWRFKRDMGISRETDVVNPVELTRQVI